MCFYSHLLTSYLPPFPTRRSSDLLKPSRDIQPVTEFRAKAAQFIEQVRENRAPMYLTQHGRSAAVLLDVERSEEHTSELQSLRHLVCRLLLEKKKKVARLDITEMN